MKRNPRAVFAWLAWFHGRHFPLTNPAHPQAKSPPEAGICMAKEVAPRRIEYLPLDTVMQADRNPRKHDIPGIRGSIKRFGFTSAAIIDDRTGRLVAGHGRLHALREMRHDGEDPPSGVQTDADGQWLVPLQTGWASQSDAEAKAYLIADNEWTLRGAWDEQNLADYLQEIMEGDPDLLSATGYTAEAVDDLLAAAGDAVELDGVPNTSAAYGETPEEEAARAARITNYEPRLGSTDPETDAPATAEALTEMVLVLTRTDRDEVSRHCTAARQVIGTDLKASEVILRALRTMTAVLDCRHNPNPVDCSVLAAHAGWSAQAEVDADADRPDQA